MMDEPLCPVCLEQFQAPIRTLPHCGHNFCENCLKNLLDNHHMNSSTPLCCPSCRGEFEKRDVDNFVRNRDLENALKHITETKSMAIQEQLEENAKSCMMNKDYENALTQFKAAVVYETEEVDKLPPFLNMARCFILMNDFDKAEEKCENCMVIFDSLIEGHCSMSAKQIDKCDEAIQKLIDSVLSMKIFESVSEKALRGTKRLSTTKYAFHRVASRFNRKRNKEFPLALRLMEKRFEIVKLFYKDQPKLFLIKLVDCGRQMEDLFRKGAKMYQQDHLKEQLRNSEMDAILEVLQSVDGVDIQLKSRCVASFYHSFAVCSNKSQETDKANELCLQAVAILKTVFASKASANKTLSFCYCLMGRVETRRKQYQKAVSLFEQALKCADKAQDWNQLETEEKSLFLAKTSRKLEKAKSYILTLSTTPQSRRSSVFKN